MTDNKDDENPNDVLFPTSPETFGQDYSNALLEQYKLYVQMADNISERRNKTNTFFLTANSFLITTLGVVSRLNPSAGFGTWWLVVSCIGGIVFATAWMLTVWSYRQINSSKYKVIHELEKKLPAAPYLKEWDRVGKGKNPRKYLELTLVDIIVPSIFIVLYLALLIGSLFIKDI